MTHHDTYSSPTVYMYILVMGDSVITSAGLPVPCMHAFMCMHAHMIVQVAHRRGKCHTACTGGQHTHAQQAMDRTCAVRGKIVDEASWRAVARGQWYDKRHSREENKTCPLAVELKLFCVFFFMDASAIPIPPMGRAWCPPKTASLSQASIQMQPQTQTQPKRLQRHIQKRGIKIK